MNRQNCLSQGAQILHRIYNFVFIKIFVGGHLDNNTKMLTNITTTTTTRTSRSSPRPAWLCAGKKSESREVGWGDWPLHECQDSHAEHPGLHVCRWQYSAEHVLHAKWPPPHTLGQCPNSRDFPSVAGPRRECGPKGQKANALSGLSHLFLLLLRSAMGKPRPRKRMQGCPYLFTKCGRDGGWGRQPGPCPLIVVRFTKKVSSQKNGTCQASIYMKLLSLNIF